VLLLSVVLVVPSVYAQDALLDKGKKGNDGTETMTKTRNVIVKSMKKIVMTLTS